MVAVAFDTLKLARRLRDGAHMSQDQAEGVADALAEAMSGAELATKGDVAAAKGEVKAELAAVKAELKADLAAVKAELKADIQELELKIDKRFEAINGWFEAVNGRFEAVNGRFEAIDRRFETIGERIERRASETEARLIRWLIGIGVAAIVTVIGTGWTVIRYLPPHP